MSRTTDQPKSECMPNFDALIVCYEQRIFRFHLASSRDVAGFVQRKHHPTRDYVRTLRGNLPQEYPGVTFYFLPADIATQTLDFGLPAPIDIQIDGADVASNARVADKMLGRRRATKESAVAAYDGSVANYRQTTLTAFQQVEDNLAVLRILAGESQQQSEVRDISDPSVCDSTVAHSPCSTIYRPTNSRSMSSLQL